MKYLHRLSVTNIFTKKVGFFNIIPVFCHASEVITLVKLPPKPDTYLSLLLTLW